MLTTLTTPLAGALVSSLLGATALATAPPVPGGTGSGDSLLPDAGNGGYQVSSYHVALDYWPGSRHLRATTRIAATTSERLSSFSLDLEGLRVRRVTVDGTRATYTRTGHELVITPSAALHGRFTTAVRYAGTPRRHTDPDGSTEGWVPTHDGATALGEPLGTMDWIPVNNTPRDKARYTFHVTAPARLSVASNGRLVRRTSHHGRTTWTWRETRPMASYLAMVSIGRYKVYSSRLKNSHGRSLPVWSFVGPGLGTQHKARVLLPKILRWEQRHFGVYPLHSAGLVFHTLGVGYALETQDRPFFDGGTDVTTEVHELAHQWYGDGNTLRDWGDIWLNEGFATYAEWWWSGTHGGPTPAQLFRSSYNHHDASAPLWSPAPAALSDPADLFGEQVYERGAMTLQALRERVGTATFTSILRTWGHREHGSTKQFIALAEQRSGLQLDTLFQDWLYTAAKPVGY